MEAWRLRPCGLQCARTNGGWDGVSAHVSAMAGNDGNGEYSDIFGRVKWASGEVEHLK